MTRANALCALLVLVASLLGASRARAQDAQIADEGEAADEGETPCAEGRVRLAAGRCCWPSQHWSDENGRCVGAPACPEGLVEHGDACVAPVLASVDLVPALSADASTARPPAYARFTEGYDPAPRREDSAEAWPSSRERLDRPTRRAIVVRGEDEGLIVASLVVFDVGWVLGWLGTVLSESVGCRQFTGFGEVRVSCDAWPWAFIPIGGGMAAGMAAISRGSGFAFGFGIPSVIFQGIGAIMAIIATANETTEIALQPMRLGESLSASVSFGAEAADAGLTVGLSF